MSENSTIYSDSEGYQGDTIKYVALYLPQFHETAENTRFWGDGFTDWNNVISAKQLFYGHNQPRIL